MLELCLSIGVFVLTSTRSYTHMLQLTSSLEVLTAVIQLTKKEEWLRGKSFAHPLHSYSNFSKNYIPLDYLRV